MPSSPNRLARRNIQGSMWAHTGNADPDSVDEVHEASRRRIGEAIILEIIGE